MAGIIKKKKSACGKRRKKKSKTYNAYMAAMAAPAEADVDVDVPAVVVAAAVVEVPPRSCVDIFTVLTPEDTIFPASLKTARMVQARDRQIAKEKAKRLIVEGKLDKSNAATPKANAATNKATIMADSFQALSCSLLLIVVADNT